MCDHNTTKKMTPFCNTPHCLFCIMKEHKHSLRRSKISSFFEELPYMDDVIVSVSVLWNMAMSNPNDPEFPSLGIFECMGSLIKKGVSDKEWLLRGQNIYIPYYCAHIIGSYTMNNVEFADMAVHSGIVPSLMELMSGKMSWVEQRVAVRALGHLASYEITFLALEEYEEELVSLSMHISSRVLEDVYNSFVAIQDRQKRSSYQADLLTRGVGGMDIENKKAEEWASQLQCWSIHLLSCFASKDKALDLICKPGFLRKLCKMWGGLVNDESPAGFGLTRILCNTKQGRRSIANLREVVESLGNLSRSSDDWQYIGIACLLSLLKDDDTRSKVMEIAAEFLVDLVELKTLGGSSKVGQTIVSTLHLGGIIERRKLEKAMSKETVDEIRVVLSLVKEQGNRCFWLGDYGEALSKYSEGLDLCPLRLKKERIVFLSNRAQCNLVLGNPNCVIRDTTRALCLTNPPNSHRKSLWRRSQAYDSIGLAKESLMDCLMFLNCCVERKSSGYLKIPCHASRLISKQMEATSLFNRSLMVEGVAELNDEDENENGDGDEGEENIGIL